MNSDRSTRQDWCRNAAFGRLRKVKHASTQALVSEYWYNGLGHRITWHADTSRSGGGAPDGSANTDDPKVHFVYNERWQQVAAYRQANGSGVDTHPKEQFVHHNAGHGGFGGGSYIDSVLLRDDHEDDWTEAADSTLERRVYYCQNWRADVVALLAENGRVLERAWYEPYGTPHGMNPADFSGTSDDTNDHYLVPDGDADADDSFVYLDLFGVSAALSDMTGSSDAAHGEYGRPNGTIDSDDYFYYLDQFAIAVNLGRNVLSAGHDGATASHGAGNLRNRRGLAGYEWDPHVRRYHVRNRVLYPEIGRWTRRDPMGYVDGMGLYEYVMGLPIAAVDSGGLSASGCGFALEGAVLGASATIGLVGFIPPQVPCFFPTLPGVGNFIDCDLWARCEQINRGRSPRDPCWDIGIKAGRDCCFRQGSTKAQCIKEMNDATARCVTAPPIGPPFIIGACLNCAIQSGTLAECRSCCTNCLANCGAACMVGCTWAGPGYVVCFEKCLSVCAGAWIICHASCEVAF